MAVDDEKDGLNEANDEQLQRIDLADEYSKGDKNSGGTEASLQHSGNK